MPSTIEGLLTGWHSHCASAGMPEKQPAETMPTKSQRDQSTGDPGLFARLTHHTKEVIGVLLGLFLLGMLMKVSSFGRIANGFRQFDWAFWPLIAALLACRTVLRVIEWRYLLNRLGQRVDWPHAAVAQLAGDAGQFLPGGIFLSNIVLKQSRQIDTAKSFAATWGMILLEGFVSLLALIGLGVAGYWYSHLLAAIVAAGLVGFMVWVSREQTTKAMSRQERLHRRLFGQVVHAARALLEAVHDLLVPRTLLVSTALTVPYIVFTIAAFYVLVHAGMHVSELSWTGAAQIYCFVMAAIDVSPLPTDIGVSEGSGLMIFLANGVASWKGMVAMLLIRIAVVTTAAVLFGLAFWYWSRVRHRVLSSAGTAGSPDNISQVRGPISSSGPS